MTAYVKKTDAMLQQDVLDELAWDSRVAAPDVGVSVKNGIVTLTGTVDTWAKRLAAQDAAHRVSGVLDVANDLNVKPTGVGMRDDTEIARAVRSALEWDVTLPDQKIKSTVDHGTVTLEGEVETWAQWDDAPRAIRNLAGVRGVFNRLTVKAQPVRTDELKRRISDALSRHAVREARNIDVSVLDGVVSLSGMVDSWAEREAVTGAVRGTRGVKRVDDHLRIQA